MTKRQFAIPYNGSNPVNFLDRLNPYIPNTHHVYLGLMSVIRNAVTINTRKSKDSISIEQYEKNCYDFLYETIGCNFKRAVTMNMMYYNWTPGEIDCFIHYRLKPLVETYKIDSLIMSDITLAQSIHKVLPELDIQTSCNASIFTPGCMSMWQEQVGTKVFNVPRELSKYPEDLKRLKRFFKDSLIKVLINDTCSIRCPDIIKHNAITAIGEHVHYYPYCAQNFRFSNLFKAGCIIPSQLKLFDGIIDIFKISGRLENSDLLFRRIHAYVNEMEEVNYLDLLTGHTAREVRKLFGEDFYLSTSMITDKTLYCNGIDCEQCRYCQNLAYKMIKNLQISDHEKQRYFELV